MRPGAASLALAGLLVVVLLWPAAATATGAGHYVPVAGDRLAYSETVTVTNGQGNYTGYSEAGYYNGSISIAAVLPNGTDSASYQSSGTYQNSLGEHYPWSEAGSFTFSAATFLYVQGSDNQTGYLNPSVWFYMDNTLGRGGAFFLLNTPMSVVSTDFAFPLALSSTGYVATIFAEGNGSYQRHDAYGNFTATYNWKAYFDPGTGYVVGYRYSEVDSDAAGDGFTYTDTLTDTQTTFPLTPTSAPPPPSPPTTFPWLIVATVAVIVVVALLVVAVALRRRSHPPLPRHPATPAPGTLPSYPPPPPLNLIPRDQPPVQQVVIRETVKVPCRYCGTLIDSTATACPKCGASRT